MGMMGQNLVSSLTGNLPKAILCVQNVKLVTESTVGDRSHSPIEQAGERAQNDLVTLTSTILENGAADVIGLVRGKLADTAYLPLEVQYNPKSISMDTQAGSQVNYQGGALGGESNNQVVQVTQPVSTTMNIQLIFDDMNPRDAFTLENLAPTVGNVITGVSSLSNKNGYSVQSQVDGLMALLTKTETRQVIFFWSKMCFRGELTSVNSRYTMFNKVGNPIRGVVDLSIRQGDEAAFKYDETYWKNAFTAAFGGATVSAVTGEKSMFSKVTNNNFLNLNL